MIREKSIRLKPPVLGVWGPDNFTNDFTPLYRYKKSQYQARGIGEYWIVDPMEKPVTILVLVEGLYESKVATGDEIIDSPFLRGLGCDRTLTAAQILI